MSYFPDVSKVAYDGPTSKNPLAFRHYNPTEVVAGKPMKDHFRFDVENRHTMRRMACDAMPKKCERFCQRVCFWSTSRR